MADAGLEYKGVASISGPIIIVENVGDVSFDELVAVKLKLEKRVWAKLLR